jgi:uncharacterized protein YbjT (DUF2867 family)
MDKSVLVIGAKGNVCLEVVKILTKMGVDVIVGARNTERAKAMHLPHTVIHHFDYCNPETFSTIFRNVDNWLLVSPPAYLNIHNCVKKVIDHAKENGVKNIVNISQLGIQNDEHPLRIIEEHIENSGMNYTFLRPNCYMQYFNTYFRPSIIEDNAIKLPAGSAKTSFVDVRDVAEAASKLLMQDELKNKTYRLTGSEALNMYSIAEIFTEVLLRKIDYFEITEEQYRMLLHFDGWLEKSIDESVGFCRFVKQGWNSVITDGIFDILGKDPIPFKKYVRDYAKYWKEVVTS